MRSSGLEPLPIALGDVVLPTELDPRTIELRAKVALGVLAASGLRALAPGELDLRLGVRTLDRLARDAGIPLVCANLVDGSGSPVFASELDVDGLRVTAVLADELAVGLPEPLRAVQARAAVSSLASSRPGGPLVVLYHGSAESAARALEGVGGVRLIVSGHEESVRPTPPRRLEAGAGLLELETKGQRLWTLAIPPRGDAHATRAVRLDALLPDDRRAREPIDTFYEQATALGLTLEKRKPHAEGGTFVGTAVCARCHENEARSHEKTPHGRALENLRRADRRRAGLPECMRCHTTGLGLEGGYDPREPDVAGLGQVGCESCHGVGSNHAFGNEKRGYGKPFATLAGWRERCIVCHDRANSPRFDLEAYLARIKHWSDERR
jgi:hypothetical protein